MAEKVINKVLVTDNDLWAIQLAPNTPLGILANSLSRDSMLFLKKLQTSTPLARFPDELLEIVSERNVSLSNPPIDAPFLGMAALSGDFVAVSFATSLVWESEDIALNWEKDDEDIDLNLPTVLKNIATTSTAKDFIDNKRKESPIDRELWCAEFPESMLFDEFWNWFSTQSIVTQQDIFKRIRTCNGNKWHARLKTTLQQLVNTKYGLFEIRCWVASASFRIFIKVESVDSVVFIEGMQKGAEDQSEAIKRADSIYGAYFKSQSLYSDKRCE